MLEIKAGDRLTFVRIKGDRLPGVKMSIEPSSQERLLRSEKLERVFDFLATPVDCADVGALLADIFGLRLEARESDSRIFRFQFVKYPNRE